MASVKKVECSMTGARAELASYLQNISQRHVSYDIQCKHVPTPLHICLYWITHVFVKRHVSPVLIIVELFTQHVIRGDYWVSTSCSPIADGEVACLIA